MHQVLRYLEAGGLPFVPRLVGEDAEHEYLTYLPGAPVFRPWPEAVRGDGWLSDLGSWLRAYHDAARGFRVQNATFSWGPAEPSAEMVVTHGDLGPWNLLHTGGRLSGIIDWDLARYGNPLDDVAELALEAVPLHERLGETVGASTTRDLLEARLEVFCNAYGVPVARVLEHLPVYLRMIVRDTRQRASKGAEPFASFERGGITEALEADLRYSLLTWG